MESCTWDPTKVLTVMDWPVPRNKRHVQSFIGFCNFCQQFIKDFSKIVCPLTRLIGSTHWDWGEEQQVATS